jgi:hypothetical protein
METASSRQDLYRDRWWGERSDGVHREVLTVFKRVGSNWKVAYDMQNGDQR